MISFTSLLKVQHSPFPPPQDTFSSLLYSFFRILFTLKHALKFPCLLLFLSVFPSLKYELMRSEIFDYFVYDSVYITPTL